MAHKSAKFKIQLLLLLSMRRPTDKETIAFERQFPRGGCMHHTGPHQEAPGRAGGRESGSKTWVRSFLLFLVRRNK